MAVIECVPNISEGRRLDVVSGIADALRAVPGLRVLDVQSDGAHNRSVLTLAGDAGPVAEGVRVLVLARCAGHRPPGAPRRAPALGGRGRGRRG